MRISLPSFLVFALALVTARADLVDFTSSGINVQVQDASYIIEKIESEEVIKARVELSEKWAYLRITPKSGVWNLSSYSTVEVRITNSGTQSVRPGVRVDQEAQPKLQAWNTASIQDLAPGDTKTYVIRLGMDYNNPKPIDTTRIAAIHIFLGKNRTEPSFLTISGIQAVK